MFTTIPETAHNLQVHAVVGEVPAPCVKLQRLPQCEFMLARVYIQTVVTLHTIALCVSSINY